MESIKLNPQKNITVISDNVFSYQLHTHMYYELTLYDAFDGYVVVNNKKINITNPTAILLTPYDFHEIVVKGKKIAKFIKLGFDNSVLERGYFDAIKSAIYVENIQKTSFFYSLFQEIQCKKEEKTYISVLINAIVHKMTQEGNCIADAKNGPTHNIVIEAVKLIHENFQEDIKLSNVAERLYITPQYLSKIFRAETGINFSKYLLNLRLNYAADRLKNTSESITQICYGCGFENLSHFHRCFKKCFGETPKKYRNK